MHSSFRFGFEKCGGRASNMVAELKGAAEAAMGRKAGGKAAKATSARLVAKAENVAKEKASAAAQDRVGWARTTPSSKLEEFKRNAPASSAKEPKGPKKGPAATQGSVGNIPAPAPSPANVPTGDRLGLGPVTTSQSKLEAYKRNNPANAEALKINQGMENSLGSAPARKQRGPKKGPAAEQKAVGNMQTHDGAGRNSQRHEAQLEKERGMEGPKASDFEGKSAPVGNIPEPAPSPAAAAVPAAAAAKEESANWVPWAVGGGLGAAGVGGAALLAHRHHRREQAPPPNYYQQTGR